MAFRLREPESSALAVLLKGAIGAPWPAWQAVGSGALSIDDPLETVDGVPLLGLLDSDGAWNRLGRFPHDFPPHWSGESLPLSSSGPWPSSPRFPPTGRPNPHASRADGYTHAEALFAVLLAAGADPWVSWPAADSCDNERDAFDLAVSWGSAALVEACLRHPSRPPLDVLHARSAWRAIAPGERIESPKQRAWIESAQTLVQLSAMCGHAQALGVLLAYDFPLTRQFGQRHPLALAQTADVCKTLLSHGVRLKDAIFQGQSLVVQWELLANVSVAHARTLETRKDVLGSQLQQVQENRTPQEWARYALTSFRRGSVDELKNGLKHAAPDLASVIDDPNPARSQQAVAQALLRFSGGENLQDCSIFKLGDYCLSLSLNRNSPSTARARYAMEVLAWAAQEQADADRGVGPVPPPGYSVLAWGQLVWAAHGMKKKNSLSYAALGLEEVEAHWNANGTNPRASLPVVLKVADGLTSSKREWLVDGWERTLRIALEGRSRFVQQEMLEFLRAVRPQLQSLGLSLMSVDLLRPMIQQEPLSERLEWYTAFHRAIKPGSTLAADMDMAQQELSEQAVPWPESLTGAVDGLVEVVRPLAEKNRQVALALVAWERMTRANTLATALPAPAPVARGPRF